MQTHTPGPWHLFRLTRGQEAIGAWLPDKQSRYLIAEVHPITDKFAQSCEEAKANAALIAAAPDLLAACKRQQKHLGELDRLTRSIDLTIHPNARNLVAALTAVIRLANSDGQSANAAIARAEGERGA